MFPIHSYLRTFAIAFLATVTIADAANEATRRQKFLFYAAIYESTGGRSTARVVEDKVEYRDEKPAKLQIQYRAEIKSKYTTSYQTWCIHVVPETATALVYSFTMDGGKTKGLDVVQAANYDEAEQLLGLRVKSFRRKNVEIVKVWPNTKDPHDGQSSGRGQSGGAASARASTDTQPQKRGLFGWLRPKDRPSAATRQVTPPALQVAKDPAAQANNLPPQTTQNQAPQANNIPPQVAQTAALEERQGAARFAQMKGKYAFVSGTFSASFGNTPMQAVSCEISGTAAKPELHLSAQIYDLQPAGPDTFTYADSGKYGTSTQGSVTFLNGTLSIKENTTISASGTTATFTSSSTHRK